MTGAGSTRKLLSAARPAGPPPDLRARIMRPVEGPSPFNLRDWLPALAAAVLAIVFAALSHGVRADIDARLAVPDDLRPVEQWLPDDIGGLR